MKTTYFILTLVLSGSLYSQVGINTSNPQGIFNVDGGKNNPASGVPSAIQAADDFTILPNGNVGMGTNTPSANLEVVGSVAFPGVSATVVPGPYQAVGINTTTGRLGTFTPGASPLMVFQTKVIRQTLNMNTAGSSRAVPINTTVGSDGPELVYNTLGATLGSETGTVGVANEYIQLPTAGTYRIDFSTTLNCNANITGGTIHVEIFKAPSGSTVYTSIDNIRVIRADMSATLSYPGNVNTVTNILAGDKIAFRFYSPFGGTSANCGNSLGTGASYSVQIIMTKL